MLDDALEPTRRGDRLSAIIPALNEERRLGSLLSDISRQTRRADEVLVVDAGSTDSTVSVVRGFPFAELLTGLSPVANGRNLGGRKATGDVLVFLDADVRLPDTFFEHFLREFERKRLDIACPLYTPHRSTPAVRAFHALFNAALVVFQKVLPSGAGHCIVIRREVFWQSGGFDPELKFDDIELIRRASKNHRFGIIKKRLFVSDRRYKESGVLHMILTYLLMSLFFAAGRFDWANRIDYGFGDHDRRS